MRMLAAAAAAAAADAVIIVDSIKAYNEQHTDEQQCSQQFAIRKQRGSWRRKSLSIAPVGVWGRSPQKLDTNMEEDSTETQ